MGKSTVGAVALAFTLSCGNSGTTASSSSSSSSGTGGAELAPTCCSCNCIDPAWSCSKETCLDGAGKAASLVPEAGLFELPGGTFTSPYHSAPVSTPRARVWYSFQPAEQSPETKPLVLLFNGGPGGPALGMLAFNIGHYTFDPDFTHGATYAEDATRWTDFANLLLVDEPGTGYSYHLPREDGSTPKLTFDAYADAADYLRVVFRFVARHPELAKSPIIVVGESYGGTRASHISKLMLDYPSLVGSGPYLDAELHDEIVAFLSTRRSDIDPAAWTPADIAQVFTHQIFVDPYLSDYQYLKNVKSTPPPGCRFDGDPLECDSTNRHSSKVIDVLSKTVTDPEALSAILRCDMSSIGWLHADQRKGAYPRVADTLPLIDFTKLEKVFGTLEAGDQYYIFENWAIRNTVDLGSSPDFGPVALRTMHDVPTLITAGEYDLLFNYRTLIEGLQTYPSIATVTVDDTAPTGAPRPGQIDLTFADTLPYGGGMRTVRLPHYLAGHSVSHRTPAELRQDVIDWLGVKP